MFPIYVCRLFLWKPYGESANNCINVKIHKDNVFGTHHQAKQLLSILNIRHISINKMSLWYQ